MTQTVPDISPLMPMHQDPLLVYVLFETYDFENWVHHMIMPNNKTVCLTVITFSEVLKYKDHDFFDFV